MRTSRIVAALAIAAALAGAASLLQAQPGCRGECDMDFQRCKDACVDAQSFDNCVNKCMKMQRECLENCD